MRSCKTLQNGVGRVPLRPSLSACLMRQRHDRRVLHMVDRRWEPKPGVAAVAHDFAAGCLQVPRPQRAVTVRTLIKARVPAGCYRTTISGAVDDMSMIVALARRPRPNRVVCLATCASLLAPLRYEMT